MELYEKTVESKTVFTGKIIKVFEDTALLPNGKTEIRNVVEHSGGVCVVPLCDNGDVILVNQFRYPYGEIVTEIPAGKLEARDESPLACGKRELEEETGAKAENYVYLGEIYPSPGYCRETIYMYLAEKLTFGAARPDENEFLRTERVPLREAVGRVLSGDIKDAKTCVALLKTSIIKTRRD